MSFLKTAITLLVLATGALAFRADEPPKKEAPPAPPEAGTLVILDSAGKEQKIKSWKFTAGTTRLKWLGPQEKAAPAKGEKAPAAPEALVLRPQTKINFAAGVTTYVPLDRLRSIEFDNEKRTITARVATSDKNEDDVVLTGSTRYEGINRLTIEADIDLGKDGVAAITYQGGVMRGGIRGIRFPTPKVVAVKNGGRPALVSTADRDVKGTHKVTDLLALYRVGRGSERLLPTLMFKRTLKLDIGSIKKIVASSEDSDDIIWNVTRDSEIGLTLLTSPTIDGAPAQLLGLVGKTPAGPVLFPLRRIVEIKFDPMEEKKKEEKKKEEKKERIAKGPVRPLPGAGAPAPALPTTR